MHTFQPGDKVMDITEGTKGEVIEAEALNPFPSVEMDLVPVLWESGYIVHTDANHLTVA